MSERMTDERRERLAATLRAIISRHTQLRWGGCQCNGVMPDVGPTWSEHLALIIADAVRDHGGTEAAVRSVERARPPAGAASVQPAPVSHARLTALVKCTIDELVQEHGGLVATRIADIRRADVDRILKALYGAANLLRDLLARAERLEQERDKAGSVGQPKGKTQEAPTGAQEEP